ncbi:MAG TPA: SCP2 sterol-binding domain-containing protein [Polyangia bacterium]|nr:SCP2 sterol-binding domain-containing protein [Polyangia bacterium]
MGNWDRPPSGIAIAEFFETWLPAAYRATARRAPANAPSVRAMISGPAGGAWDLEAEDDHLVVTPASGEGPDVLVRQSSADFRAAFDGDPDLPVLIPPGWTALDLLFLDAREAEALKNVQGRILLELVGKRARRWALDCGFGKTGVTAGRPRTTIRVDGATFEGMQTGAIPPLQPLLDGRLALEGDRGLAMQLLLLLGGRLARR